jgi:hypothetical protein
MLKLFSPNVAPIFTDYKIQQVHSCVAISISFPQTGQASQEKFPYAVKRVKCWIWMRDSSERLVGRVYTHFPDKFMIEQMQNVVFDI